MDRRIRILTIGPAPAGPRSRGGMATVMRLLIDNPDDRFEIRSISTFEDSHTFARLWTGITGMVIASWLVLSGRADLVHVHLSHGGSVLRKSIPLLAARVRRVPAVVHGHSFNFAAWMRRQPVIVQAVVRSILPADLWLVLSSNLAAEYQACLGLAQERIKVLHNPVRLPTYSARQDGIGVVKIVSLGRLGKRKGSYDLVNAVALLPHAVRNRLDVSLAGDGEVDEVRRAVGAAGLRDVVNVLGWVDGDRRDELLGDAQVFVLPSYDEGLPMAILEAMAAGLVTIATPVGGVPDVVTDGVDGILVSPGRPEDLSCALASLVDHADRRVQLGNAARERARNFELTAWYEELARIWTGLITSRGRGEVSEQRSGRSSGRIW